MDYQKLIQQALDNAVEKGTECGCQAALFVDGELAANAYAGWTDWSKTKKVDQNTVFPIYSCGKAMTSTVLHRLVEMGKLDYNTRIADIWPEFGCNGKEDMRVWHVLSYRSAMWSIPDVSDAGDQPEAADKVLADFTEMTRRMAAAPLDGPYGENQKYHPQTYGWLTGGIACKVLNNEDYPAIFRELVGNPAGMDRFYYGISDDEDNAVTLVKALDGSCTSEAGVIKMNKPVYRQCCNPSTCAMSNALSVARHYAALDSGKLLSKDTIDNAISLKWRAKEDTIECVLGRWELFGLGYVMSGPPDDLTRIFGHGGLGGSEALLDQKHHYAFAYTRNCFADPNACFDIYDAINFKNRDWPEAK